MNENFRKDQISYWEVKPTDRVGYGKYEINLRTQEGRLALSDFLFGLRSLPDRLDPSANLSFYIVNNVAYLYIGIGKLKSLPGESKMTKKNEQTNEVVLKDRYGIKIELDATVKLLTEPEYVEDSDEFTVIAFTKDGKVVVEGSYSGVEKFDPSDLDVGNVEHYYIDNLTEDVINSGYYEPDKDDFCNFAKCECGVILHSGGNKVVCPSCDRVVELRLES